MSKTWPRTQLAEAIAALAEAAGFSFVPAQTTIPPREEEILNEWLQNFSAQQLLVTQIETNHEELAATLQRCAPSFVIVEEEVFVLVGASKKQLRLLAPDKTEYRCATADLVAAISAKAIQGIQGNLQKVLEGFSSRKEKVLTSLTTQLLHHQSVRCIWLLQALPAQTLQTALHQASVLGHGVVFLLLTAVLYGFYFLSWWLLGSELLQQRINTDWLLPWGLLLLTTIPFSILQQRAQNQLVLAASYVLRERLFLGAMSVSSEETRGKGAGHFLGQILEADSFEILSLSGSIGLLVALFELGIALFLLVSGSSPSVMLVLLLLVVVAILWRARRYQQTRQHWVEARIALTNHTVEKLLGHRTRMLQEQQETWHVQEDQLLYQYVTASAQLDRQSMSLQFDLPKLWPIVGLLGLFPSFVLGNSSTASLTTQTLLAQSLAGLLLAASALAKLGQSLGACATAWVSWQQSKEILLAPVREGTQQKRFLLPASKGQWLLDARELVFRYRRDAEPVLRGVSLRVRTGDRVLIEGSSGGGKSTLASLLARIREPESGVLLIHGIDYETSGEQGWRERVAFAPQFHENHIFENTLAFNLLLGREWPARETTIELAEEVCRELGLGDLIDKMPSGMYQQLGECGWQLSQGEKSRIFMARALLQNAELLLLDESVAALDPDHARMVLATALRSNKTIVMIAHP